MSHSSFLANPPFLSNELLKGHLAMLPADDRTALMVQLGCPANASASAGVIALSRMGSNSVVNQVRGADTEPTSYASLLSDCYGQLILSDLLSGSGQLSALPSPDVPASAGLGVLDQFPHAALEFEPEISAMIGAYEQALLGAVFKAVYDSLTPEQSAQFAQNLSRLSPAQGGKLTPALAAAGGTFVLGNLGGFGTYMAMSSLLSTLSFGTLGFGAYTAASSLLSVAMGPAGWAAFGAVLVAKLGAPDEASLLKALAIVALAAQSQPRSPAMVQEVASRLRRAHEEFPRSHIDEKRAARISARVRSALGR